MKALTLALALAAGSLALAPAVQAQSATAAPAVSAHGKRIGDQLEGQYTRTNRYRIAKPDEYRLPAPPAGFSWYLVDDTAYLVQAETNLIVRFEKVQKA